MYTDLGLFTADPKIGADIAEMFNYLTGYARPRATARSWSRPSTSSRGSSPRSRRRSRPTAPDAPARIRLKMNALLDPPMIQALYRASQAGVEVELNVRGICGLRPGVPGRLGQHPRRLDPRPVPRALADLLLRARQRSLDLHRLRRPDAPQPLQPGRAGHSRHRGGAARRAHRRPRPRLRRQHRGLGTEHRRLVEPAQPRRSEPARCRPSCSSCSISAPHRASRSPPQSAALPPAEPFKRSGSVPRPWPGSPSSPRTASSSTSSRGRCRTPCGQRSSCATCSTAGPTTAASPPTSSSPSRRATGHPRHHPPAQLRPSSRRSTARTSMPSPRSSTTSSTTSKRSPISWGSTRSRRRWTRRWRWPRSWSRPASSSTRCSQHLRGFKDLDHYWIEIHRLENDGDRIYRDAVASLFSAESTRWS